MSSSLLTGIRQFGAIYCAVLLITGCGHEPIRKEPADSPGKQTAGASVTVSARSAAERAALVALRQLGVPYRYGGASTRGFDCSGLVHFAYSAAGKTVPRTTAELWRRLEPVSSRRLRVGDVLFFRIDGDISHVGLYLGKGRFVHAPASGRSVSVETLESGFYSSAFVRGGRPLADSG